MFKSGQRVIYMKTGQSPYFNTDWPATYLRKAAGDRHVIRCDGQRRSKNVKLFSLRAADQSGESR